MLVARLGLACAEVSHLAANGPHCSVFRWCVGFQRGFGRGVYDHLWRHPCVSRAFSHCERGRMPRMLSIVGAATRHILAGITGLTGVPPPASHLGPLGHTSAITASLFVWPTTGMRRLPVVPTMAFGTPCQ